VIRTLRRLSMGGILLGLCFGGAAATVAVPASASVAASKAAIGPARIGPHQHFAGVVNGAYANAIIEIACPLSGKTGRALSGQTLEVTAASPVATDAGYTGGRGKAIDAIIGPAATTSVTIQFKYYGTKAAFPTNIPLPCDSTGVITFVPVPGSHSSVPAKVTVSYENVAVGP
jgi:hypothetical protein